MGESKRMSPWANYLSLWTSVSFPDYFKVWSALWIRRFCIPRFNLPRKTFRKKSYGVDDVCWVVRPTMVASVLNTYGLPCPVVIPSKPRSNHHLHSIYLLFGIISNLEIIQSVQEDGHKSYANTVPLYIQDSSTHGFWYLRGPWSQPWIPRDGCHVWRCGWAWELSPRWSSDYFYRPSCHSAPFQEALLWQLPKYILWLTKQ